MNNVDNSEVNYCTIALVARAACVVFAKSAVYVALRNQLFILWLSISCLAQHTSRLSPSRVSLRSLRDSQDALPSVSVCRPLSS